MTERKAFNFYKSYYDVFKELNDKDKLLFIEALLDRQFLGLEPENLNGMSKLAYIGQKANIDSQVKGWEDKTGCKLNNLPPSIPPSEPPSIPPSEPPSIQEKEEEKEEEKEKEQVKDIFYLQNENYLLKLQSYLKGELIELPIDIIIKEADSFVNQCLVNCDTNRTFPEYANHFTNKLKKLKTNSKKDDFILPQFRSLDNYDPRNNR